MTRLEHKLGNYDKEILSFLASTKSMAIALLDKNLQICDSNPGFLQFFNLQQIPYGEPLASFLQYDALDLRPGEHLKLACSRNTGLNATNNCYFVHIESGFLLFCDRQTLRESRVLEKISEMNNELINLQREATKKNQLLEKIKNELAERIADLETAAARVKKLEGIIPICAYCKKIRDDREVWNQLEEYITDHSEARFSHGICPHCLSQQMTRAENITLITRGNGHE